MDFDEAYELASSMIKEIKKVIVGKDWEIIVSISALLSEGHVLIEGPPGAAKTLLAKSIARVIGGEFRRIQGNPDILPSDITGFHVYSLEGKRGELIKGPIFAHIVFFDELNRTPTRSQAALLEAMQEGYVTIDGIDYELPKPFMLIATEIPETISRGTYPLTLTLVDRFMVRLKTTYNPPEEEYLIVSKSDELDAINLNPVTNIDKVRELIKFIKQNIHVDERIVKYIVDLITYIRRHKDVATGLSHRASISLYRIVRSYALIEKRDYVIPDDIKKFAKVVLAHRILLSPEAEAEGLTPEDIVDEALNSVKVPKE
ncbi:MoxR family ATPase [Desulfurococcaceae archaeon MEX13E-LK6-19]|nr:MoxR family ATPase [Desulfurococcaceae archaeon MEX13E-LK6-19]